MSRKSVSLIDDFILANSDFIPTINPLPDLFHVMVKGLVIPSQEGIDIEIHSVIGENQELCSFLKLDAEHDLKVKLRTIYLNKSRAGHEGDSISTKTRSY